MPEPPSEIQSLNSTVQQMMQHMMTMQEESRKNNENLMKLVATSLEKKDNVRNCNAVTTLRSGKQFNNPEPPMQYQSHEEEQVQDEDEPHESGNFEHLMR